MEMSRVKHYQRVDPRRTHDEDQPSSDDNDIDGSGVGLTAFVHEETALNTTKRLAQGKEGLSSSQSYHDDHDDDHFHYNNNQPQQEQGQQQQQQHEETRNPIANIPPSIQTAQRLIFLSHAVSQFSEKAWDFAVILFLAAIAQYQSILLVSTYSLSVYLTNMALATRLGHWLDRTNRWQAARLCIGLENGAVLVATICCCWLLTKQQHQQQLKYHGDDNDNDLDARIIPTDPLSITLLVGIHFFGALANLLNQAFVVAIERDWIVVLSTAVDQGSSNNGENSSNEDDDDDSNAQGSSSTSISWLSQTNVVLRQIYLSCKVLSPTFAGWLVGGSGSNNNGVPNDDDDYFCDLHNAAVLVGVLCMSSLVVEYVCARRVYHLVPQLGKARRIMNLKENGTETENGPNPDDAVVFHDEPPPALPRSESSSLGHREATPNRCSSSLTIYWQQPIVWAGLALALMNTNGLCFGGTMTTYLLHKNMSIQELGIWRGLCAAMGLAGTVCFTVSKRHVGVIATGEWSVVYLFACLTVAVVSFLLSPSGEAGVYMLVVSTAVSRIGLWVFDICVTLLYQEMVPDGIRSLVGGTQQSLNSFFTVASGCLGLIFRQPDDFCLIAVTGWVCIGFSCLLYTLGVYRRRGYDSLKSSVPVAVVDGEESQRQQQRPHVHV